MMTERLPTPQYQLLARVNYKVTRETVVSLCVVQTSRGSDLRLYKWRNFPHVGDWRVAHANLSLADINLEKMASDAKELAAQFGVTIKWFDLTNSVGVVSIPIEAEEGAPPDPPEKEPKTPEREFLELLRESFGDRIPSDQELIDKAATLEREAAIRHFLANCIRDGVDINLDDIPS